MDWERLLPLVSRGYQGSKLTYWFLVLIAVVSTVRSLIHVLAPDGGAHSIAGLAVDVQGGANLIALFAQWGAIQLILAPLYWVAILRYRFLVPLLLAVALFQQLLRLGVGLLKPLQVAVLPPGAEGSCVLLTLSVLALMLFLRQDSRAG
jgi:hypothetical protein